MGSVNIPSNSGVIQPMQYSQQMPSIEGICYDLSNNPVSGKKAAQANQK